MLSEPFYSPRKTKEGPLSKFVNLAMFQAPCPRRFGKKNANILVLSLVFIPKITEMAGNPSHIGWISDLLRNPWPKHVIYITRQKNEWVRTGSRMSASSGLIKLIFLGAPQRAFALQVQVSESGDALRWCRGMQSKSSLKCIRALHRWAILSEP